MKRVMSPMRVMSLFYRLSILCLTVLFAACTHQAVRADLPRATESAPPAYGELLTRYATPDGVRYAAWHANGEDMEKLRMVVDFYANTLPPQASDASLAWHLNAYNAWMLFLVLENYPLKSVTEIASNFGVFNNPLIRVSGERISLDELEKKRTLAVFKDPRIHFAVNCASESCPPLHNRPFTAASLEADLDQLTRSFINKNPQGIVAGREGAKISQIFEWYAGDFDGKDQLIDYINRYRAEPLPTKAKIQFLDYSWKLNEAKK